MYDLVYKTMFDITHQVPTWVEVENAIPNELTGSVEKSISQCKRTARHRDKGMPPITGITAYLLSVASLRCWQGDDVARIKTAVRWVLQDIALSSRR